MFAAIAVLLIILWLGGWLIHPIFAAVGGLVHILIVLAVIALLVHLFMGRRAV